LFPFGDTDHILLLLIKLCCWRINCQSLVCLNVIIFNFFLKIIEGLNLNDVSWHFFLLFLLWLSHFPLSVVSKAFRVLKNLVKRTRIELWLIFLRLLFGLHSFRDQSQRTPFEIRNICVSSRSSSWTSSLVRNHNWISWISSLVLLDNYWCSIHYAFP
jgi:hypothetical protein